MSVLRGLVIMCTLLLTAATSAWAQTPIRLVTYGSEATIERYQRIAEAFERDRPGYKLEYEVVALGEYPQKISIMVAAGSPPDVFQTIAQQKVRWSEQGILTDLRPYLERSAVPYEDEIFPFMLEAAMYQDKLVGIPFDFSSMAITINVDALNNAGLGIPDMNWNSDDYREYAIRLTRPDNDVYGTTLSAGSGINNWIWAVNFTGDGWLSEDRTEVLIESPEYIEMLEYWKELIDLGAAPAPGRAPSRNQWAGGYGMWGGWVHWGERMATMANYDWAMAPYPAGPGGDKTFAHGHMWSMPVNARDPERSWVFFEWLLSPEGQRTIVEVDARQPLTPSLEMWDAFFATVQADKQAMMYELVLDVLYGQNRLHTMQYWETWPDVEAVMNQHLGAVWRGDTPPTSAMNNAARQLRAIIAGE